LAWQHRVEAHAPIRINPVRSTCFSAISPFEETNQMKNRIKNPDVSQALSSVRESATKYNKNRNRETTIQVQLKKEDAAAFKEYAKANNTDISKLVRAFIRAVIH